MREILESRIQKYAYPDLVYGVGPLQHRLYRYLGSLKITRLLGYRVGGTLRWPFFHPQASGMEVHVYTDVLVLVEDPGP